jgi:hypothetical protein
MINIIQIKQKEKHQQEKELQELEEELTLRRSRQWH